MSVENTAHGGEAVVQVRDVHGNITVHRAPRTDDPPVPDTLPTDTAVFRGREREVAALLAAAGWSDGARSVTVQALDGMAGVGKTALAVHVAHRLADRFPGGRLFLNLGGHVAGRAPLTPGRALLSLLSAVGADPRAVPEGVEERAAMWRDRTSRRRLIVVLDDAVDTAQVRPLLPAGGSLVLVTSRRRLTALPGRPPITVEALDPDEGAALLCALSGRELDEGVARLVTLSSGLPLAIGVVSGHLRHRPAWEPADLAADLAASQGDLVDLRTEDVSVSSALDLSYGALPSDRRRLLRLLALHPGGEFGVHAAAALTGDGTRAARTGLDDLYDHHLLIETVRGRYRLHDLVRAYLRTREEDSDEEHSQAMAGLFEMYLRTAWSCERLLRGDAPWIPSWEPGGPDLPVLRTVADTGTWLRAEFPAMYVAVEHAETHGHWRHAMDLPAALAGHLDLQGRWKESVELQSIAVRVSREHGTPRQRAQALSDLGWARYRLNDRTAAKEDLERALAMYREADDTRGTADTLMRLHLPQRLEGDHGSARAHLQEALGLYEWSRNRHGTAQTLDGIGVLHTDRNEGRAAVDALSRALAARRSVDDRTGTATSLDHLGQAHLVKGDPDRALDCFHRALALHDELGNVFKWALTLGRIGGAQNATGHHRAAIGTLDRAIGALRNLDHQNGLANAHNHRGQNYRELGESEAAMADLTHAAYLFRLLHNVQGEANTLCHLAELQEALRKYGEAARSAARSAYLYGGLGNMAGEARARAVLGSVQGCQGRVSEAESHLRAALSRYQGIGSSVGEANTLIRLGRLHSDRGAFDRARDNFDRALSLATEHVLREEAALALEGLGRCLLRQGRPEQAAPLLREARARYLATGSPHRTRVSGLLGGADGDEGAAGPIEN
jgi:tetratricopeptide (TPR) repeat protein